MSSSTNDLQYYEAIFTLALRKSCNALRQLLDAPISHENARVTIRPRNDLVGLLGESDDLTIIHLGFTGTDNSGQKNNSELMSGHLALCFNAISVRTLVNIMTAGLTVPEDKQTDLDRSCVNEVGNVFSAHLLSTIANIGMYRLLPTPPTYLRGRSSEVTQTLIEKIGHVESDLVYIETQFSAEDHHLIGNFFIFPQNIDDINKMI